MYILEDMANFSHGFYFWANDSLNYKVPLDEDLSRVINSFRDSLFTVKNPSTIVLLCFYVPVFLTSLAGNILVLLVIAPNKQLQSVTNNFLLNLAIADLLVTVICIPMTCAQRVYQLWIYGDALCKMTQYLQGIAVGASTFTITAMSLDRCLAIRHPVAFRRLRTTTFARILIVVVWVMSLLIMIPLIIVRKTVSNEVLPGEVFVFCIEQWPSWKSRRIYDIIILMIVYILPGIIIMTSYILMGKRLWVPDKHLNRTCNSYHFRTRQGIMKHHHVTSSRRRLAKLCIAVALMFAVCWLPYYMVNTYLDFYPDMEATNELHFTLLLGHLHSATNPILYCFLHKTFRCYLKKFVSSGFRMRCSTNKLSRGGLPSNSFRGSSGKSDFRASLNYRLHHTRTAMNRNMTASQIEGCHSWRRPSFISGSESHSHSSARSLEEPRHRDLLEVPIARHLRRGSYCVYIQNHRPAPERAEDSISS